MIIIISVTISFTTCGLRMRIRLYFEQEEHILFLRKNHINWAIFCSVTTCCRLAAAINLNLILLQFCMISPSWPVAKQHSASELRLFLFLHKEASLGGIRRSIAIAGLWGWLIWMLKQQTVQCLDSLWECRTRLFDQNTSSIYGPLSLWVQENRVKLYY